MIRKTPKGHGISIARTLQFDGPQSSYFGVAPATSHALQAGDFIGDTRLGGSCNTETLTLNPHCHGTHTESIGHVVDQRVNAIDVIPLAALRARLVSLATTSAARCDEQLTAATQPADQVLTLASLRKAIGRGRISDALIVRTRPNSPTKKTRQYRQSHDYPFFTRDAVQWLVDSNLQHLLIDTPSVDRLEDNGNLEAHRVFWQLPAAGGHLPRTARRAATITEMIYVHNGIKDGRYELLLQPAPFSGDATPSNPTLFAPR